MQSYRKFFTELMAIKMYQKKEELNLKHNMQINTIYILL